MPIDITMHLAQPSYPRSQAVPLRRLPLRLWHRGVGKPSDPSKAPGVFGPTAVKWYSKMAAARAILVDGLSCRQMGMVLSKTGAASDGDRGPVCPPGPGATNWGEWHDASASHAHAGTVPSALRRKL